MPVYTFKAPEGQPVEVFCSMSEATPIGGTITQNGITLTRVVDKPQLDCRAEVRVGSAALHRWAPGAKSYSKEGKPQFGSKIQVDEFIARSEGDYIYE